MFFFFRFSVTMRQICLSISSLPITVVGWNLLSRFSRRFRSAFWVFKFFSLMASSNSRWSFFLIFIFETRLNLLQIKLGGGNFIHRLGRSSRYAFQGIRLFCSIPNPNHSSRKNSYISFIHKNYSWTGSKLRCFFFIICFSTEITKRRNRIYFSSKSDRRWRYIGWVWITHRWNLGVS